MKKVIFLITTLLMSTQVSAESFVGIYGTNEKTTVSTAGKHSGSNTALSFGQSTNGKTGVGYEAFFNNAGLGGMVEAFTIVGGYKVSLGAASMPEDAYREPVANWPKSSSSAYGDGVYIGISKNIGSNKYISVKYIRYDVDHSFTSTKKTGVDVNGKDIFTVKSGVGYAEREQIWVGITFRL